MEIWKVIPSIPDFEASSDGRIRRVIGIKNSQMEGGIIKQQPINRGYMRVSLYYKNKPLHRLVHRLVAEAFFGICSPGLEVNHKDDDVVNNRADNLEYITPDINKKLGAEAHNLFRGESNSRAKTTDETVKQIRAMHAQGMGYKRLAKMFGISWGMARSIANRRTWKHI